MLRARGFSLAEMMIVVAIAAVLLSVALPSLNNSIIGVRAKGVAESIHAGLLRARAEAIKRNSPMRFQMVSTLDSSPVCTYSATQRFWVVTQYTDANSRGQAVGKCHIDPYFPADQGEPCPTGSVTACATDPFIAFKSQTESATNVDVVASPTMTGSAFIVTYGPLGQLLNNLEGNKPAAVGNVVYTVNVCPNTGNTVACTGTGRKWRVQINANGGVLLCDPNATDSMACPT